VDAAGSSQISRWTAFVLSIKENDVILWDPEIGDRCKLSDSRCSLMKVSRLINHSGVSMKQLIYFFRNNRKFTSLSHLVISLFPFFPILQFFSRYYNSLSIVDMGKHAEVHFTS